MQKPMPEYTQSFTVYRHDGDPYGRLKPAALLRYAQQIAMEHAFHIGLTDEVYARTHTAYVLAKLAVHFDRVPQVDETLTLLTQPQAVRRAVNKRITRVLDQNGEQAALIDSRWVVIDTQKRIILRKHPPEFDIAPWAADVPAELPMKMQKPPKEECQAVGVYTAGYSTCDMNGHLNNTRYVDMLFDGLPLQELQTCTPRDLMVFYHKEVPLGGQFTLLRRQTGPHSWYFGGWLGEHCCFEATLTFTEGA